MPPEKTCRQCGVTKSTDEYWKKSSYRDGLDPLCRTCSAAFQRQWRKENPKIVQQYHKLHDAKRRTSDPLYYVKKIYGELKRRSVSRKVPFDLSLEDVLPVPQVCPVLGVPMLPGSGHDYTPSLDKVIPSLGYVRGNVVWMSNRANRIKNDATLEELTSVTAWLRQHLSLPHPL